MIEDDVELAEILSSYLLHFDMQVSNYADPFMGLSALQFEQFDLIILDLTLPGIDGLEICQKLLKTTQTPIIISSARSDIQDKITALELGADDYLPKPYDPRELALRITTLLRRYNTANRSQLICTESLFVLDESKRSITKANKTLELTFAEYQILALLCRQKAGIVSRYEILEALDSGVETQGGSIAVLVNRIRSKIEDDPKNPKYLLTIRGMGYKLVE